MKDFKLINYKAGDSAVIAEENDLEPDANGDFAYVDGHDRKLQDVVKILCTAFASNPVYRTYGSELPTLVGTPIERIDDRIRESIISAISFLVTIEPSKLDSEQIAGIRSLNVKSDPSDKSRRIIELAVALKDGQDLELVRRV